MRTRDKGVGKDRTPDDAARFPVNVLGHLDGRDVWYYGNRKALHVYTGDQGKAPGATIKLPMRGLVGALRRRGLLGKGE